MSTGAIIAIVAVVVIALIALIVVIPRMRRSAAERRLKWEREKRATEHREQAKVQQTKAELAEQEARKQRAEAEIHAKRAELHEHGLADHELESAPEGTNGRHDDPVQERSSHTRDHRDRDAASLEDPQGGGRFREVNGGGRAHEPATDGAHTSERRFVRDEDRETAADSEHRTLR